MDNFDLRKYLAEGKLLKEEYNLPDSDSTTDKYVNNHWDGILKDILRAHTDLRNSKGGESIPERPSQLDIDIVLGRFDGAGEFMDVDPNEYNEYFDFYDMYLVTQRDEENTKSISDEDYPKGNYDGYTKRDDLPKLSEGRLLKEDIASKAISVLKSYEGEVEGVEGYIKYLMNTSDDISSSIQAIADDLDRDNDTSDSLRRDLEKLSLAEGKLLKENMSLEVDDDYIELSADSGDYDGDLNDDGTVDFSVVGYEEEREDGEIDFDEDNWKDILGPKHAFVQISNKIPTKVEAIADYVMITVDLEDLKNLLK